MTLGEWRRQAAELMSREGIDSPELEVQLIISHVLEQPRSWVIAHPEFKTEFEVLDQLVAKRISHKPLAHLLGWKEFYGRRFEVCSDVLIPRQETETLVDAALLAIDHGPVLDIGTGSGCIAITIKLERPDIEVVALDISPRALMVAKRNAENLSATVEFIHSDLFQNCPPGPYEAIITNPPYIGENESLPPEVKDHEPSLALFSGPSGLEFYRRLAKESAEYLSPSGKLMMEVGYLQAEKVGQLFKEAGWTIEAILKDLTGVNRVVIASRK